MVRAELSFARLAVVPFHPYIGTAVVILVVNPAAAAVVVLIPKDQTAPVVVDVVIASHDLPAGGLFGLEVNLCANHWSPPRGWQESMKAAGRRLAGRTDHDARAAPFGTVITQPRLLPFCTFHERIGTPQPARGSSRTPASRAATTRSVGPGACRRTVMPPLPCPAG